MFGTYEREEEPSCTLLTRATPSLALMAAAFQTQLGNTNLLVTRCDRFDDVKPNEWGYGKSVIWIDFARDVLLGTARKEAHPKVSEIQDYGHKLCMVPQLVAVEKATQEDWRFPQSFRILASGYFGDRSAATANLALAADRLIYPEFVKANPLADFLAQSANDSMGHLRISRCPCDPEVFRTEVKRLRRIAERFSVC